MWAASWFGVAVAYSYDRLKNDPAIWGWENPAGLVALPCRKRRSIFNFHHCCTEGPRRITALTDTQIEEGYTDCFQRGTASEIRFAMDMCCDDRDSVLSSNHLFQGYFDFALCLSNCTVSDLRAPGQPDCGCERSFMHKVLRKTAARHMPLKKKSSMAWWSMRMAGGFDRLRKNVIQEPEEFLEHNLRFALRMLEHLSLSAQLWEVPEAGQPMKDASIRFLELHDLHTTWSSMLRQRQQRSLPSNTGGGSCLQPAVHVALIASVGSPAYGKQALATVRSALFHAKQKLHFHIFVDTAGRADMEMAMQDLEPWLELRIAKVDFYGAQSMKKVWPVVSRYVPAGCLGYTRMYGFPGWMRLFPHEIKWKAPIEDLIWVDAGDFLFFADPGLLLAQHKEVLKSTSTVVATHPRTIPYAVQVFSLQKMQDIRWSVRVGRMIGIAWTTNHSGNHHDVCYMAEGVFMSMFSQQHPHLFGHVADEWSHEPRVPFFNGILQQPGRSEHFINAEEVWNQREHPGLIDYTRAYVFCPTFADFWAHAVATGSFPFFVVEMAQSLEVIRLEMLHMLHQGYYSEVEVYGGQDMRCGRPVLGMHLIRQFHETVPWSLRLLDFWSNSTGLWGKKRVKVGPLGRDLPANADAIV